MSIGIINFIRSKHIDSFQKLRFLLFLYQHPGTMGTSQEFAERLYFGDSPLVTRIIQDLQRVGLLDCIENRYQLRNEPTIRMALQTLTEIFENPLARQALLDQIKYGAPAA